jgi:hypothetical protein
MNACGGSASVGPVVIWHGAAPQYTGHAMLVNEYGNPHFLRAELERRQGSLLIPVPHLLLVFLEILAVERLLIFILQGHLSVHGS